MTNAGAVPVENGDPETCESDPPEPIENTETLLDPELVTNNNFPPGSTATELGAVPTVVGEPEAVSVEPDTPKARTALPLESATKTS